MLCAVTLIAGVPSAGRVHFTKHKYTDINIRIFCRKFAQCSSYILRTTLELPTVVGINIGRTDQKTRLCSVARVATLMGKPTEFPHYPWHVTPLSMSCLRGLDRPTIPTHLSSCCGSFVPPDMTPLPPFDNDTGTLRQQPLSATLRYREHSSSARRRTSVHNLPRHRQKYRFPSAVAVALDLGSVKLTSY